MKKADAQPRRAHTGIPGFDDILNGGFPQSRLYLVQGAPGSGKTTLALQFLLAGAAQGEKVLYISLSETRDEVAEVADSHHWSLAGVDIVELSSLGDQFSLDAQNTLFHPSEVELTETTRVLLDAIERVQPTRLAFDSLSELRLLSQTSLRYRRQILALKQFLTGRNCTTIFLDDTSAGGADAQVESLAHGVLVLDQVAPEYGAERRRLLVRKIRGTEYRGGYHDFVIETGGISFFPRLIAAEHHRDFTQENISSGIAGLDTLLGGGLSRGTSNLFLGPPGTGKSSIALSFVVEAALQGCCAAIYTFDESLNVMMQRAKALNSPFQQLREQGQIMVRQIDPAELSPGELSFRIRDAVESKHARVVLIDSLNGYLQSMGDQRFLSLQLHELITYLNQQGVVTILVLAQHGLVGAMQTPVDITYLADTVVVLRFYEADGAVHRAVSVIKKRTGNHERTIRELEIANGGVTVGPPLGNFCGVLTGTPMLPENLGPDRARSSPRPSARKARHASGQ